MQNNSCPLLAAPREALSSRVFSSPPVIAHPNSGAVFAWSIGYILVQHCAYIRSRYIKCFESIVIDMNNIRTVKTVNYCQLLGSQMSFRMSILCLYFIEVSSSGLGSASPQQGCSVACAAASWYCCPFLNTNDHHTQTALVQRSNWCLPAVRFAQSTFLRRHRTLLLLPSSCAQNSVDYPLRNEYIP